MKRSQKALPDIIIKKLKNNDEQSIDDQVSEIEKMYTNPENETLRLFITEYFEMQWIKEMKFQFIKKKEWKTEKITKNIYEISTQENYPICKISFLQDETKKQLIPNFNTKTYFKIIDQKKDYDQIIQLNTNNLQELLLKYVELNEDLLNFEYIRILKSQKQTEFAKNFIGCNISDGCFSISLCFNGNMKKFYHMGNDKFKIKDITSNSNKNLYQQMLTYIHTN